MTTRYASLLILVLLSGCGIVDYLGGASSKLPADIDKLSSDARALVERSLHDIDPAKMIDYHLEGGPRIRTCLRHQTAGWTRARDGAVHDGVHAQTHRI